MDGASITGTYGASHGIDRRDHVSDVGEDRQLLVPWTRRRTATRPNPLILTPDGQVERFLLQTSEEAVCALTSTFPLVIRR